MIDLGIVTKLLIECSSVEVTWNRQYCGTLLQKNQTEDKISVSIKNEINLPEFYFAIKIISLIAMFLFF